VEKLVSVFNEVRVGLYKILFCFWAFVHELILFYAHPSFVYVPHPSFV